MPKHMEEFRGRPVIYPQTEIIGGVLLADCGIVVDYPENPEPYEKIYADIDTSLSGDANPSLLAFARTVDQVVVQHVWHSEQIMGGVLYKAAQERGLNRRLGPNDEINLSSFIEGVEIMDGQKQGGGVCYVVSAVEAVMFHLAQQRRGLPGKGSLERVSRNPLAHTWYRHDTDEQGDVVVDSNNGVVASPHGLNHPDAKAYLRKDERKSLKRAKWAGRLQFTGPTLSSNEAA